MVSGPEGGLTLPKAIDLKTVVFLAAMGASFWAQWSIFTERSDNQSATITMLYAKVDANEDRIRALERETDVIRTQLGYLLDAQRRTDLPPKPKPAFGVGMQ